jgi:DNA-binding GntR family transcriptional regulator
MSRTLPPTSTREIDSYDALREAIVSGALSPGERLVEEDLAKQFGIGRTAVRTTLVRLEHDGLVNRQRHRGASVRRVSEGEAVEILEARAALESLAVRRAAARATRSEVRELRAILTQMRKLLVKGDLLAISERNATLHRRLLEISGHETAQRICGTLHSQMVRFQFRTILVPGRPERSLAEHGAIVEAVAQGDPDAAERAMRRHLGHVTEALREAAATG